MRSLHWSSSSPGDLSSQPDFIPPNQGKIPSFRPASFSHAISVIYSAYNSPNDDFCLGVWIIDWWGHIFRSKVLVPPPCSQSINSHETGQNPESRQPNRLPILIWSTNMTNTVDGSHPATLNVRSLAYINYKSNWLLKWSRIWHRWATNAEEPSIRRTTVERAYVHPISV